MECPLVEEGNSHMLTSSDRILQTRLDDDDDGDDDDDDDGALHDE